MLDLVILILGRGKIHDPLYVVQLPHLERPKNAMPGVIRPSSPIMTMLPLAPQLHYQQKYDNQ